MSAPATPPTPKPSRSSTPDPSGLQTGKFKGLFRKSRKFFRDLGTSSKAKGKAVDAAEVPPTPAAGAVNDAGVPDPPTVPVQSSSTGGETKEKVVSAAEAVFRIAAGAVGDAGVPGLAGGLSVVAEVLKKFQTMAETVKGVSSLDERIEELSANLEKLKSIDTDQALSKDMQCRLSSLIEKWAKVGERADHIAQRGCFTRFVMSGADAKELKDLLDDINTSIQEFILCEVVVIGGKLYYVYEAVKAIQADLDAIFMPIYAKRAQYNASSVRRQCLAGTRVVILDDICGWILIAGTPDAQGGIVYWVSGLAGTGKTTIAYSVAQWCKDRGILGASFFFSRQDAECRDPNLIFVTICRQLCQFHAPFKAEVTKVLQKDPSVVHSSPTEQFEKLILEPLEALQGEVPKTVIVFDALDECEGEGNNTSTTLTVLGKFAPRIAQRFRRSLTFVLTGRPKRQVTALFEKSRPESLHNTTQRLLLHMVKLESVKDDIRRCIEEEFKTKIGVFEVEEDWPSEQNKDELADLSGGLFILATTAVRYIMDTKEAGVPQERMDTLLQSRLSSQTPQAVLTVLYTKIAEAASPRTPGRSATLAGSLHHALGTIALAREPLSSTTLGGILGMSTANARNTLIGLHSVLHIPDDHDEAIRIIHPTFPEFLLATDLEKPADFCIIASEQHAFLFERNLQIMQALKMRNIVGLSSHLVSKDEVPTLKADVERSITSHLSYSIRHWTAHLDAASDSPVIAGKDALLHEFLHRRLLYWLETSSLLGALEGAATGLNTARIACRRIGAAFAAFVPLLADSRRFALTYFACIDATPLELYYSALGFAPDQSLVKQVYRKELRGVPIAQRGVTLDWEPCIKTFSASVNRGATRIDFSPDLSIYVDDKSRICNVTTQKVLTTLDPQTNDVTCAAFCPDGQHVALVSEDQKKTLDVWHLISGERVHSFEGHSNDIMFVTYSADGRCILSADEHEVRLWSVSDRQSLLALPWDLTWPCPSWGIALSPDGSVIALPDPADNHLCLYSTASQEGERLPLPGTMRTAAFSSDGRYVAASTDTTISIWTLADRSPAHSLHVTSLPYRLAFSTDSTRLGVGLEDGSVHLWQIASSQPPVILHGHTWSVYNIIWSLDDSQIISVSYDDTVRIWDATRSPVADGQPQLPTDIISLPDSPRPTVLCNLEGNLHIFHLPGPAPLEPFRTPDDAPTMTLHANIAEAWDAALSTESSRLTDAAEPSLARDWELLTGQRHISPAYSPVTLSQDATFMAFMASPDDKTVRVCNLCTGEVIAVLSCHDTVNSTAFSPDGSLLATGSDDKQVRVWDIATQQIVDSHTTHTHFVLAVAFSHGGQLIASGGADGVVCLYALADRRTLHTLTFRAASPLVMMVTFSAGDAHVIALDNKRHALIGDTATGAIIHQVSLSTDDWTCTLDFTPDHTGLLVHAEDGRVHKINMGETGPRIWPVYHLSVGGWVTEKSPGRRARRVCWLPREWRGIFSLGGPLFCAVDTERSRSVVIDVSEVEGLEVGLSPIAVTDLAS